MTKGELTDELQVMEDGLRLAGGYESSDEVDPSVIDDQSQSRMDCESETALCNAIGRRPVKSGVHTMIDKKIFLKFNKLTKTLKETRSNLLTVDQMLGKYKGDVRLQKSETLFDGGGLPRMRRASSLPPPARMTVDCRLCGGDNSHQHHRSQSVDNFEIAGIFGGEDQDLRIQVVSPKTETAPTLCGKSPRGDQVETEQFVDSLQSVKGSDISICEPSTKLHESLYTHSPQPSSVIVEELRVEVLSLKTQLNKMQATGQFQGQNLVLCQQLEGREKQIGDMSRQLQELSNKLDASEEQRRQLMVRLEETLRTSLDVGAEAERFAAEVKRMEQMASDVQADKDRLRRRARKVVQDLKEKCKKYVADAQRLREREWELEQRSSQCIQDKTLISSQLLNLKDKLHQVTSESETMQDNKKQVDKLLQQKDVEIAEVKAVHQELKNHLQQFKDLYEKLVEENESLKNKLENAMAEKSRVESLLAVADKEVTMSRAQLEEVRVEIRDMRMLNGELLAQSLTEAALRKNVEQSSQEMSDKIRSLEKQLEDVQAKFLESVNDHGKIGETLRNELVMQKTSEENKYQEALKTKQMLYETRFTAFKLDLAENQATVQTLKEAMTKEQDGKAQLKINLTKVKDDYGVLEGKYRRVLRHYHSKKRKNNDKEHKIQLLQDSLVEVQEMGTSLDDDFKDILRLIYIDIGVTANIMANGGGSPEVEDSQKLDELLTRDLLSGIKTKLRWLQDELRRDATCRQCSTPRPHHTVSVDSVHTTKPLSPSSARSVPGGIRESNPLPFYSPVPTVELNRERTVAITDLLADRTVSLPSLTSGERPKASVSEPHMLRRDFLSDSRQLHRTPSYPFNSTELHESQRKKPPVLLQTDQGEILKRYQRFQKIFEDVNAELSASKIRNSSEESLRHCHVSTGLLSITSSLSSISEFSTDTTAVAVDQTHSTVLEDPIASTVKTEVTVS